MSPVPVKVPGSAIHAAYPLIAPLIEAALPAHDAPGATARELHDVVGLGRISTTRSILRGIAAEGRAEMTVEPFAQVHTINRYRRAAPAVRTASNGETDR